MIYLILFWEFFKTGLFAIGGGLATLPFLTSMADRYDWITHQSIADMIAISESTPGPLGVNMATWTGYQAAGFWGAFVATFSMILPSVTIILLISGALKQYQSSPLVQNGLWGLRPAVTGLIAAVCASLLFSTLLPYGFKNLTFAGSEKAWTLFAITFLMLNLPKVKKLHPIIFILFGALFAVIFQM